MITNRDILWNQINTDLGELKKDVDEGLYVENTEGYMVEVNKIIDKVKQTASLLEEELQELVQSPKDEPDFDTDNGADAKDMLEEMNRDKEQEEAQESAK